MIFEMKLQKDPFQKVALGIKTIELRLFDEKRHRLNIGDDIIFTEIAENPGKLAVRIKALYRYESFADLFTEISPERCGNSRGESIEDATSGMNKYYSESQIRKYGVLGIKMELIPLEDALNRLVSIKESEFERLFLDGMK